MQPGIGLDLQRLVLQAQKMQDEMAKAQQAAIPQGLVDQISDFAVPALTARAARVVFATGLLHRLPPEVRAGSGCLRDKGNPMLIKNEFEVAEPVEKVWQFFDNIPQVAACLPVVDLAARVRGDGAEVGLGDRRVLRVDREHYPWARH